MKVTRNICLKTNFLISCFQNLCISIKLKNLKVTKSNDECGDEGGNEGHDEDGDESGVDGGDDDGDDDDRDDGGDEGSGEDGKRLILCCLRGFDDRLRNRQTNR